VIPDLRVGFQYSRARVKAAIWRRDQGRPAAAFPGLFNSFNPAGATPSQPTNHPSGWPANAWGGHGHQQGGMYHQPNPHGPAVPAADPWSQYPVQNTPGRSNSELPAQPQARSPTVYTPYPNMVVSPGGSTHQEYPPPPFPPPNWRPPSPVPGTPPVTMEVSKAVEVAICYLEAVNKVVNLCIEANAM